MFAKIRKLSVFVSFEITNFILFHMKKSKFFFLALAFSPVALFAQWNTPNIEGKCGHRPSERKMEFYGYKQSSLMNNYDVHFYFLDISLENTSTYISGSVTINSTVVAASLDTFAVELIDTLRVDSVFINGVRKTFIHNNDHIFIPLSVPIALGTQFSAQIFYHGDPHVSGSFFSGISNASSPSWGNQVTWTLSQPFNASQWWPCKQVLTDKADSSWVFITTTNPNKAGSNGLLKAVVAVPPNKTRYEWKGSYPIDFYLISAAVAHYVDYSIYAHPAGTPDSLLVQNYVYDNPSTLPYFKTLIDQTTDFIELYSNLMGIYPFMKEKYGHCMAPLSGGMEHQTMTTLGYFDYYIDCHELAHMWFGDNVTCATWSDIWINEGFASYGEYLVAQYLKSYNEAQSNMLAVHNNVMSASDGSVYVPPAQTNDENRIFDSRLSYDKGSAIIHMIRFEMQNDTLFFNTLKTFQNDFRDSTATGLDFRNTAQAVSGVNLTDFFNQWYFGEGYPTYHVTWNQSNNMLNFTATQTVSSLVTPLFKMLMEYKINYTGGDTLIRVYQTTKVSTFSIPFTKHVTGMVVDPNNWVVDGPASVVASVEDFNNPMFFTFTPNPCTDHLDIYFPDTFTGEAMVSVRDLQGRKLMTEKVSASTSLNTSALTPGIYMIITEGAGERVVKKFAKY
jgi:aminopeptidase N